MDTVEEESGIGYKIEFLNDEGEAATPLANTIFWDLRDDAGEFVNSKEDVAITPSASIVYVATTGDDNIVTDGLKKRSLRVRAKYNSTNLGNGIDLIVTREYTIIDRKGVPST